MLDEILKIILTGILGVGGGGYLVYRINSRKVDQEGESAEFGRLKSIMDLMQQEDEKLRKRVSALEKKLKEEQQSRREEERKTLLLERELHDISTRFLLLEGQYMDFPFPYWIKTAEPVPKMQMVNKAYEDWFLTEFDKTGKDYNGKDDITFWTEVLGEEKGLEIGSMYLRNERISSKQGVFFGVEEAVRDGDFELIYVCKYVIMAGNVKISKAGFALPIKKILVDLLGEEAYEEAYEKVKKRNKKTDARSNNKSS